MEPSEWVASYPRTVERHRSFTPFIDKHLKHARMYAERFGVWLHDHLSGRPAPDRTTFEVTVGLYAAWFRDDLGGLARDGTYERIFAEVGDWDAWAYLTNELNFHRLNVGVSGWWRTMLYNAGQSGPDWRAVEVARTLTAINAMELTQLRRQLISDQEFWTSETDRLRSWMVGAATELDALVAVLEYVHQRPGSFVVPAPPQFESLAGRANVDLVVYDPIRGGVVGVQVKASAAHRHLGHYDRRRVVLLDGDAHLGNRRAVRTTARSSAKHVVSWPGPISAHHLLKVRSTAWLRPFVSSAELASAQRVARREARKIRSSNSSAYGSAVTLIDDQLRLGD